MLRRAARWVVAAAAVVVVAFGLSRLGLGVAPAEASLIADYRSHHSESVPAGGLDLQKTYEFFLEEFGLPVAPVAYDAGEANRAMICLIDGRRVATVEYEIEGHPVAHYRVPLERVDREIELTTGAQDNLHIVRWSDDDFEHALVSDMDERRLLEIARKRFSASD